MPCPRCGSSHITEEYKLTVCTDCGYVLDDSRLREEGPQLGAPPEMTESLDVQGGPESEQGGTHE